MGFCDPSPAATKVLLVYYTFKVSAGGSVMGASRTGDALPLCTACSSCCLCRQRLMALVAGACCPLIACPCSKPPCTHPSAAQGRPYRAVIADTEGAVLPARGSPVEDAVEAELVLQLAEAVGAAAAGAVTGLSGAPSAASLASSSA